MRAKLLILAATIAAPARALAHPGHGAGSTRGWIHYLLDPYHLTVALLAAACVATVFSRMRATAARVPLGRPAPNARP